MLDADAPPPPDPPPLPTRSCGECTVCCTALTIDDPELTKVQGVPCRHIAAGGGCGIYHTRPRICRTYYCGWRQLKWVRETLRPDRSGVLVQLRGEIDFDGTRRLGVTVTLLRRAALQAEGLAESIAAGVAAGIPVYVSIPGAPGYTAAEARINDALEPAVAARDKPEVLRILREVFAKGSRGPRRRVRISPPRGAGKS
jgi:hypothetical protein